MPRGPKGEKRPADVIGNAIMVAKIATGEIEDEYETSSEGNSEAAARGRLGGAKGGRVRAERLTPEQRTEAARIAAQARWRRQTD